eukprot:gb/GECH01004157.1/.p1 GENE.gb/GECH01004157.1/~~gb/GECH01004157.1/.p1  ORF type:complete len:634 (+),score=95.74 gb/GECH01004157.1/:1-1902(+)
MRCRSSISFLTPTPQNSSSVTFRGRNHIKEKTISKPTRLSFKSIHTSSKASYYEQTHFNIAQKIRQTFSPSSSFYSQQRNYAIYGFTNVRDSEEYKLGRQIASIHLKKGISIALDTLAQKSQDNSAQAPSLKVFRTIISSITRIEDAEFMIEEMHRRFNLRPDVNTLGPLLVICAENNDAKRMEYWWKRLTKSFGSSSSAYFYLLRACLRGNLLRRAREAQREVMEKNLADKRVRLVFVELCRLTSDRVRVLSIFRDLLKDYPQDEEVFDTAISTLAFFDPVEAENLANEMEESGVAWTRLTYHSMLKVYAHDDRDLQDSVQLLDKMRENKIPPSVVTYTLLLEACKRGRDYKQARRLIVEMMEDDIRPNNNMFTILVSLLSELRDSRVFDMLKLMEKLEVKPNLQVYTSLLKAAYNLSAGDKAKYLVDKMKAENIKLDTMALNVMMRTLANTDHFEDAWQEFLKMENPDRISYAIFLNSFAHHRRDDKRAFDLITMICDSGIKFTHGNFTSMLTICQRWKRLDTANQILYTMKKQNINPNEYTLSAYLAVCFACDELQKAIQYFDKHVEQYNIKPTTETLHTMLRIAVDKASPTDAKQLIELVEKELEKRHDAITAENAARARKLANLPQKQ